MPSHNRLCYTTVMDRDPICYLVLGAESSGTRIMAKVFIAMGCLGSADHQQPFDDELPPAQPGRDIVWRRSVPHNVLMPTLMNMYDYLYDSGYQVKPVIVVRDWNCTAASQVRRGLAKDHAAAIERIRTAYDFIFRHVDGFEYIVVSYDNMARAPLATLTWLAGVCGLPVPTVEFTDENAKWLSGTP